MSIAVGIARGLDHIYKSFQDSEIIPHGNLKLSNILLNENEEPLISEYGYSTLFDPKSVCLFRTNGYTAPERALSEQGDVFSFGVILLELLTGKIVENSGLDLPKWVKAMVREEWTGEVFDKEIAKVGMYAFPLLNVSLKCVAHFAENRPSIAEVLETIEGVVDEDLSCSSGESSRDGHVLYSVAEEG
nr:leucine-rich repeat receptor-like protein kinase PXC1 [Tanacetum cinerariifolium]